MRDPHLALLVTFLALIVYGSLTPWRFESMPIGEAQRRFVQGMLVDRWIFSVTDVIENVAMMIPVGLLASAALFSGRLRRAQGWTRWLLMTAVVAGGATLAASLEFAQVFVPSRIVSSIDVVSETTGTAIGVALWHLLDRLVSAYA